MTAVPLRVLEAPPRARFDAHLSRHGGALRAERVTTLQINVGKKCNQACRHCHVDAGPLRTEVMPDAVVDACLAALAGAPECDTLDVTGGAPELHPRFREIVRRPSARARSAAGRSCGTT